MAKEKEKKKSNKTTGRRPIPRRKLINHQISQRHADYDLFFKPWCPLFGDTPVYEHGSLEAPLYTDSLDIIDDARQLIWRVHDQRKKYDQLFESEKVVDSVLIDNFDFPPPNVLSLYPKDKLLMAHRFFNDYEVRISPFLELLAYDYKAPSFVCLPSDTILECIEKFAGVRGLTSAEVFSLIALSISWEIVKRILINGNDPNSADILAAGEKAKEVIARAKDDYLRNDGHAIEMGKKLSSDNKEKRRRQQKMITDRIASREEKWQKHFDNIYKNLSQQEKQEIKVRFLVIKHYLIYDRSLVIKHCRIEDSELNYQTAQKELQHFPIYRAKLEFAKRFLQEKRK